MPQGPTVSRRTVAAGIAWSAPGIAALTQAPAYAVSPTTGCTNPKWYQVGRSVAQPCAAFTGSFTSASGTSYSGNGGVDWNNAATPLQNPVTSTVSTTTAGPVSLTVSSRTVQGTTAGTWSSASTNAAACTPDRTCSVVGVAPTYPNYGCTKSGMASLGAPEAFANNGVGLSLSLYGGATAPIHEVTFSFSETVCGFMIRLRDFSWYDGTVNTSAGGRDAVYFSQPPATIIDDGPGTNMSGYLGTGSNQASAIRRVVKGAEPANGINTATPFYSDMMFVFGPTSSITMTYFNAAETDNAGAAVVAPLPSGRTAFTQIKFARILI